MAYTAPSQGEVCGYSSNRECKYHTYANGVAAGTLMAWIAIQCFMLQAVVAPHVLFFVIGLVEGLISLAILLKLGAFPVHGHATNYRLW